MTIKQVNWKEVKAVVENGLVKAQLSKLDINDSLDTVRVTIKEVLELYVAKRYIDSFGITTTYKQGSYTAILYHESTELCSWSGLLA